MKFAEHYNQATLFFESQTAAEKAHIIAAFRFELSKVTVPAIRNGSLSMLLQRVRRARHRRRQRARHAAAGRDAATRSTRCRHPK